MSSDCKQRVKVVISGAGPAGIFAAIQLLHRNSRTDNTANKEYFIDLVDPGVDYGKLDSDGLKRKRSWMIGLSNHGVTSLKTIPGLYEDYVQKVGVPFEYSALHFNGGYMFKIPADDFNNDVYVVDRNYIVASLSKYLNDHYGDSPNYKSYYGNKLCYVDGDRKVAMITPSNTSKESAQLDSAVDNSEGGEGGYEFLDYDLILGCDGIRSAVRNSFVTNHRDFQMTITDLIGVGKGIHVKTPPNLSPNSMHVLLGPLPDTIAFCLPETDGVMNINLGVPADKSIPPELQSTDIKLLSNFFRSQLLKSVPQFATGLNFDDMAKQWIEQDWATGQHVHCNRYHSEKLSAALMGDAAHATSPQIGQGMNQAFVDVRVFVELLEKYDDDLRKVFPEYSLERVKEGNALTFLSYYAYSMSSSQQLLMSARQGIRKKLHSLFPNLVEEEPYLALQNGGKLSDAYNSLKRMGRIDAVRKINEYAFIDYFERTTGMVYDEPNKTSGVHRNLVALCLGVASIAATVHMYIRKR